MASNLQLVEEIIAEVNFKEPDNARIDIMD
jgi:hypothetical protein